jgi:hypothetical protein
LALTDHKKADGPVLRSWHVTVKVPVVAGGAGRRTRLPSKLTRLAQQDAAAGHAEAGEAPWFEDCGPRESAAGHGCGPAPEEPVGVLAGAEVDPWACALARLREHLRRARAWYAKRVAEPDLTVAALAQREGVAPARVSEALALLRLSPAIGADLERRWSTWSGSRASATGSRRPRATASSAGTLARLGASAARSSPASVTVSRKRIPPTYVRRPTARR